MLGDINPTQKDNYHRFLSYAVSRLKKQSRDKTKGLKLWKKRTNGRGERAGEGDVR